MMKKLHNLGVTLGIHTLETFSTNGKIPTKANQTANIEHLRNTIKKVTGKYPRVASYHGSKAAPHPNIHLRSTKKSKDIQYVRGISSTDGGRYNTPVLPNNNNSLKNLKEITTFFFHSNELILLPILSTDTQANKKRKIKINERRKITINFFEKIIDTNKYHHLNYYNSMKTTYK